MSTPSNNTQLTCIESAIQFLQPPVEYRQLTAEDSAIRYDCYTRKAKGLLNMLTKSQPEISDYYHVKLHDSELWFTVYHRGGSTSHVPAMAPVRVHMSYIESIKFYYGRLPRVCLLFKEHSNLLDGRNLPVQSSRVPFVRSRKLHLTFEDVAMRAQFLDTMKVCGLLNLAVSPLPVKNGFTVALNPVSPLEDEEDSNLPDQVENVVENEPQVEEEFEKIEPEQAYLICL